jgi:hypothetical protein
MMLLRTVILWLALGSVGFAAEPFTRAAVEDTGRIVPGQQVQISIDVFVPDFFTSPPQFPLFDLPNAIVTLPDDRAQNLVETIDGVQYAGIRRTYAVVPETSGTFTLPPAVITLGYSQDGKPVSGETTLPATSFTVAEAPGGATGSLTFAARGLTISQSFDRDPSSMKVGDALVRTITVFAENTQAMMIPAIPYAASAGMKQYAKSPQIADGVEAGDRTTGSTRTETITYVAEAVGRFEIPAVSYPWFDVDAQAKDVADLPATSVKVSEAAAAPTELAPQIEQTDAPSDRAWLSKRTLSVAAVLITAVAVVCWLVFRALSWLRSKLRVLRKSQRNSERRKFKNLVASIRVDDPLTIYRSLEGWTRSAGYESISKWVTASRDGDVASETEKLQKEIFGLDRNHPGFNRTALVLAVRAARGQSNNPKSVVPPSSLPKLNPDRALG